MNSRKGIRKRMGGGGRGMGQGSGKGRFADTRQGNLPKNRDTFVKGITDIGKELMDELVGSQRQTLNPITGNEPYKYSKQIASSQQTGQNVTAVIDTKLCIGCGLCVDVCPSGAIYLNDKAGVDSLKCTGCGVCAEKCPRDAISLVGA